MKVDVLDKKGKLIFTYEIVLDGLNYIPSEGVIDPKEYFERAKRCAQADKLVPDEQLSELRFEVGS